MRVNIRVVPHIVIAGIVFPHRQHLFVQDALVQHLQQADGAHLLHAAGKARPRHQHQHVQRVAVVAQRGRNKAVIAGVVDRGVKIAVQLEDVQLLVVFKLLGSVQRNFNDRAKDLGGTIADRQFKIINHCV